MLDGAARVNEVIAAAAADGQPAIGITDHGNMYGVLDFYKEARAQGLNPVIGLEAYQAAESRFERPVRRGRMDDSGGEAGEGQKLYYHLTLLCVQTGSPIDDPKRFRFEGQEHYLKTAAEMRHLFRDIPEACDNTLWVAQRAQVDIEFGKPELPRFEVPAPFSTEDEYLRD